jgi:ankyrin repeat protein
LHYCSLKNRAECTKLLLKANINIQLRNNIGLDALEIANDLKHFECAKQINLFMQGKPIERIDTIFLYDRDEYYLSDSAEDLYGSSPPMKSSILDQPSSYISLLNRIQKNEIKHRIFFYY